MLMKKLTYTLPQKSSKKDFIFNMFGSLINAAVSVILLVVVSRIVGGESAGLFSLGYSTAQMMYTICVFEMRNIQVTDAKKEFGFSSIFMFRIITIMAMWLFFAVFCAVKGYSGEKLWVMAALSLYMSLLSLSDLFQGNLHLNGYLSISGKSLGLQVLLAATVFTISLCFTKSLIISIIPMAIIVLLWILLYDIPINRNFSFKGPKFDFSVQKRIFLCAIPLFLSSFIHQYIFNAPKYAIDDVMTAVDQSHYGYLIMPAFFINLLSIFVFRPQLVPLSQYRANGEYKRFIKTVALLYFWIIIVTVFALICGYFLGIPVLEMLYGADLSGKRGLLLILLTAGAFSAGCSLTGTLITIMRKQAYSLVAYFITLAIALFLPKSLVSAYGMLGAALTYLIEMAALFVFMLTIFIFVFLKARRENKNGC